jgi:LacI family transcriptional regulator
MTKQPSDNDVDGRRRPTMRDVGERAGVSFKTVSRVVNGESGVSPALAERVQKAIDELGYHRDQGASTLRRADGRTQTIATVLEDISNPFSAAVLRSMVDTAAARGVLVIASSSDEDQASEREAIAVFSSRRVDGIILMATSGGHEWLEPELRRGTAIVCVDRPAEGLDVDAVVSDNRAGAVRAVNHLIRRGHRRIAFLGDLGRIHTAAERRRGYEEALAQAGLPVDDSLIRIDLRDGDAPREAVIELLTGPAPPTAILAGQNLLTLASVRALRQLNLHNEVALVGIDDIEAGDLLKPGITVVAQDPAAIGRLATERLFRRIDGDRSPSQTIVAATRLVPRGSGEILPARALEVTTEGG